MEAVVTPDEGEGEGNGAKERRASRNPKVAMEREAARLIATVTDIETDEENFEICKNFALSNLFYHKFLDPDELKVNCKMLAARCSLKAACCTMPFR